MAYKNYKIRDNWLDIDKYNDVDIQSVDGVIQNVKVNGEDVGGSSWRIVFEDSVTTETLLDIARAVIQGYELTADTIKVTFNGTVYECGKNADGSYGAVMAEISYDWSEYPFALTNTEGGLEFTTETAGTYTLKIEEPQGGSSDFSTAEVTLNLTVEGETVVTTALDNVYIAYPSDEHGYVCAYQPSENNKCKVLLYKGTCDVLGLLATDSNEQEYGTIVGTPVTTGGVRWVVEGNFEITGDGTITATLE